MNRFRFTAFLFSIFLSAIVFSQPLMVDKVIGVVGKSSILFSQVEEQYLQAKSQGMDVDRCDIYEDYLSQKLLVTQAEKDSVEVTDAEVELELEQRMIYFEDQLGSEEKLMEYFGKSIPEIKDDMRSEIRDQMLVQRMQGQITSNISVTPKEVERYYNNLPKDSIPYIDSEIELKQIVFYPESDAEAIFKVKEKLLKLRERVINGESFATMAVLYSEGPSASRGGDIGWVNKADLDPAYSKAASVLKINQVSRIVESSFGYHIIQLIDKTDTRIKTRHILMQPKVSFDAKQKAINNLDSLVRVIRLDSISFENAALLYSQDEDSRMNGGIRTNKNTQTTKFKVDEISTSEYYIIRQLKVGEISPAFESKDDKGKVVYKIVQLKSKTEPHPANLKLDFDLLKKMAAEDKKSDVVDAWLTDKVKDTYIKLEPPFNECNFRLNIWH